MRVFHVYGSNALELETRLNRVFRTMKEKIVSVDILYLGEEGYEAWVLYEEDEICEWPV